MSAVVIWRPEPLTARLIAATRPAAAEYAALAKGRAASRKVTVSVRGAGTEQAVVTNALGAILEKGAGPHQIKPKGTVLRLADGRFVTGPVRHPGSPAKPFLRPLLPLWASMYRRWATRAFRGF